MMRIFLLGRDENIVGKGENAGYQHFLLSLQCFRKQSLIGSLKVRIVLYRVNKSQILLFGKRLEGNLRVGERHFSGI